MILDEPKRIRKIDKDGILNQLQHLPEAFEEAVKLAEGATLPLKYFRKYDRIVFTGMGGSAIAGELTKNWLSDLPIEIFRDYSLPAYVGPNSLVFAVSYSGNTEETLASLLAACQHRSTVISVGSGGKLEEFAHQLGAVHLAVPKKFETRAALPYLMLTPAAVLRKLGVADFKDAEWQEAAAVCREVREKCRPEVPLKLNPAKQLAKALLGLEPIVYASGHLAAVAHRWKAYFNENSKVPSRWEVFPELNHFEAVGWENLKLNSKTAIILLRDSEESDSIKARVELTKSLVFKKSAKHIFEIRPSGQAKLARLLSLSYFGDFVSCYLAILQGVNPTLARFIPKIKGKLEQKLHLMSSLEESLKGPSV